MKRIELIAKIASLYQRSYDHLVGQGERKKLDAATSALNKAMGTISESLIGVNETISTSINEKIISAIAEINGQKTDLLSRESLIDGLTGDYQEAVVDFTATGGTGFYDVGVSIYVTYDKDVAPLREAILALSEEHDIQLFVEDVKGNPEHSSYRKSAKFGVVLPSSKLAVFKKAVSTFVNANAVFDYQQTAKCDYYFISPLLNDLDGILVDPIAFLKGLQDERLLDTERSGWEVENMFSLLGCARYEFGDHFGVEKGISFSLSTVMLYNERKSEHCNRVMPTGYYYSDEEVNRFGLDASGFDLCDEGKPNKVVNMLDELTIFNQLQKAA